ncbi:DNA helicase RecQ [Elusimicrobiota bacterium]
MLSTMIPVKKPDIDIRPKENPLLPLLKRYFGFPSFRPLQEDIIRDALANRDVFALLPTGGGKSLCFQLPALARPGLTVVVSPLISLMKDQVDALQANGIPATFLNSSLGIVESRTRLAGLHRGEYRILYMAPERMMLDGLLGSLGNWDLNLIAIDEAHCISEWGHDFRPEYRELAKLRTLFPKTAIMALTATATKRVRADITKILGLRSPKCYVASFNRPNLTYRVLAKDKPYNQIIALLRKNEDHCGIIYCQSRKSTEYLANRLKQDGIAALPYHAGMSARDRSNNQDLFLRDEAKVICATIAFGMGINKPNVRFVMHYDLPKNIEGYYQETGRAGRDSLPSDCILLFNAGDVVKQTRFIDEKPDLKEQVMARTKLSQMVHYAESAGCRRKELLGYFGEDLPQDNCGSCDNCLTPKTTFNGTGVAHKFLSCVRQVRSYSGFGVGTAHITHVLTGANTEKIRRWNHEQLPIYGTGKEYRRNEWAVIGRELVRLGLLRQTQDKFSVLELTPQGLETVEQMKAVILTKPMAAPERETRRVGEISCDETLFASLKRLRRKLADQLNVPAYIIFSDVALRQMARYYPSNENELLRISGVGEKKLKEFGSIFLDEIRNYLDSNPRQEFTDDAMLAPAPVAPKRRGDSARETLKRFCAGESPEQISRERSLVIGTIHGHLAEMCEAGENVDINRIFTPEEHNLIKAAFAQAGISSIAQVYHLLGEKISYGQLRIYRAALKSKNTATFKIPD